MVDNVSKEARSRIMARVRGQNTIPELELRKAIFHHGFRYRLHVNELPGTPDIVFPRYRTVIFVNGCFWHWHGCRRSRLPSDNVDYWRNKIERNRNRDRCNYAKLFLSGWRVLIVWECSLKKSIIRDTVRLTCDFLKGSEVFCVIEPEPKNVSHPSILCECQSLGDRLQDAEDNGRKSRS